MVLYVNKEGVREGVLGKRGGQELDRVRDGKELAVFLGQTFPITDEEGDKLVGYMEGHDYLLGTRDGQLYRGDLCYDPAEIFWERYPIDSVIATVSDWNYELKEEAEAEMRSPDNFSDFVKKKEYYDSLCADEEMLAGIYMRIREGIETGGPVQGIADKILQEAGGEGGSESSIEQTKEEMYEEIQKRNAKALEAKGGGRGR